VLRAFADWGVICDSDRKGEYAPASALKVADTRVVIWLLEAAVLSASDASVDFDGLVNGPSLFPFQIGRIFPEQLMESGRLDVVRHGLESTLVRMRPATCGAASVKKKGSNAERLWDERKT
jgi:hypothetical protein